MLWNHHNNYNFNFNAKRSIKFFLYFLVFRLDPDAFFPGIRFRVKLIQINITGLWKMFRVWKLSAREGVLSAKVIPTRAESRDEDPVSGSGYGYALDIENQPGSDKIRTRSGSRALRLTENDWNQKYENKKEGSQNYPEFSFNIILNISYRSGYRTLDPKFCLNRILIPGCVITLAFSFSSVLTTSFHFPTRSRALGHASVRQSTRVVPDIRLAGADIR